MDSLQVAPPTKLPDHTELPWLRWWDLEGNLLLTGEESAEKEKQGADKLAAKLRELGVDVGNLSGLTQNLPQIVSLRRKEAISNPDVSLKCVSPIYN